VNDDRPALAYVAVFFPERIRDVCLMSDEQIIRPGARRRVNDIAKRLCGLRICPLGIAIKDGLPAPPSVKASLGKTSFPTMSFAVSTARFSRLAWTKPIGIPATDNASPICRGVSRAFTLSYLCADMSSNLNG
jgi:hypothetical protein